MDRNYIASELVKAAREMTAKSYYVTEIENGTLGRYAIEVLTEKHLEGTDYGYDGAKVYSDDKNALTKFVKEGNSRGGYLSDVERENHAPFNGNNTVGRGRGPSIHKFSKEVTALRLVGRLERVLKDFGFTEDGGSMYSPTYGLSEYNKIRKQVAQAIQKAGYERLDKEHWALPDGEKIRFIGFKMHRGWAFSIETA